MREVRMMRIRAQPIRQVSAKLRRELDPETVLAAFGQAIDRRERVLATLAAPRPLVDALEQHLDDDIARIESRELDGDFDREALTEHDLLRALVEHAQRDARPCL